MIAIGFERAVAGSGDFWNVNLNEWMNVEGLRYVANLIWALENCDCSGIDMDSSKLI